MQIGLSVSRIGAKTQLPSYRSITGALKLTYSQFEELESFASFGTRLDEATRRTLERGRRIRQVLNQPQNLPIEVTEQIGVLMAVTGGVLDEVPLERIDEAEEHIRKTVREDEAFRGHLLGDEKPSDEVKEAFFERIRDILKQEMES